MAQFEKERCYNLCFLMLVVAKPMEYSNISQLPDPAS